MRRQQRQPLRAAVVPKLGQHPLAAAGLDQQFPVSEKVEEQRGVGWRSFCA